LTDAVEQTRPARHNEEVTHAAEVLAEFPNRADYRARKHLTITVTRAHFIKANKKFGLANNSCQARDKGDAIRSINHGKAFEGKSNHRHFADVLFHDVSPSLQLM
jgi:hypothetical protein